MTSQEFIFSNKPAHRFTRHLLFWIFFALHFTIQNLMIGGPGEAKTSRTFFESLYNLLYFFPVYLLSTYLFTGGLLPFFLFNKKYFMFTISSFLLLFLTVAGCYWAGIFYIHNAWKIAYPNITFILNKYHTVVNGIFIPAMIWGIAGGFKSSRKWYEKQKENEQLARQKIATEIKLLKIQIHPRFLFHTLSSVQEHIHNVSKDAPAMVLQLSDLLSYSLYESDLDQVLLEKEIEIVQSYIHLQKAASKKSLVISIRVLGNAQNKTVAPLMLFAFTENCFECFFDQATTFTTSLFELEIKGHVVSVFFIASLNNMDWDLLLIDDKVKRMEQQLKNLYPLQNKIKIDKKTDGFIIEWQMPIFHVNAKDKNNNIFNEEKIAI